MFRIRKKEMHRMGKCHANRNGMRNVQILDKLFFFLDVTRVEA